MEKNERLAMIFQKLEEMPNFSSAPLAHENLKQVFSCTEPLVDRKPMYLMPFSDMKEINTPQGLVYIYFYYKHILVIGILGDVTIYNIPESTPILDENFIAKNPLFLRSREKVFHKPSACNAS